MSPGSKQQREERIVLLGAMGTGKSTLCKHLAVTAARTEVGPVPLLVRVRSWVERGFEGSVLDAAARSLAEQTGLPIAAAQLGHLCELGRVVMLVDGIDEGDGDLREQLNARLLGFATSHPRVTMIVTSRVHGYEGHALPPSSSRTSGLSSSTTRSCVASCASGTPSSATPATRG